MIYAACRWWNGNVVMLCMTVSRGSPRSSWHLIKLRLWTTSDKMAPWCNGGRESRRSSVPPKQELRTNLLNLFYQSCLPGAQEREEEQGLGSEGEGLPRSAWTPWSVYSGPLCAVWPSASLGQPAPGIYCCSSTTGQGLWQAGTHMGLNTEKQNQQPLLTVVGVLSPTLVISNWNATALFRERYEDRVVSTKLASYSWVLVVCPQESGWHIPSCSPLCFHPCISLPPSPSLDEVKTGN